MRQFVSGLLVAGLIISPAFANAPHSVEGTKCTVEKVKDTQKSGLVAFTFLVPTGWTPHSLFNWDKNGSFFANLSASSPDKHTSADVLEPCVLTYGWMNKIAPKGIRIDHATDFLHALVSQMQTQQGVTNVETVEEVNQDLPLTDFQKKAATTNWGPMHKRSYLHETGFLKVTFQRDGVEETANLGTTVTGMMQVIQIPNSPGPTTISQTNQVGPTVVIVTESHASLAKIREAQIVASSMHMTPQFLDYWRKMTTAMAEAYLRGTAAALKENNDTWHGRAMASFRDQMAAKDANTHDFCNYLLDQQDYRAPGGGTVTLPTYIKAYTNSNGEYLISDNPQFVPSGAGSQVWEQLVKKTAKD